MRACRKTRRGGADEGSHWTRTSRGCSHEELQRGSIRLDKMRRQLAVFIDHVNKNPDSGVHPSRDDVGVGWGVREQR